MPVCGHRSGYFWLGFVQFGDRFGSQIDESRLDSKKFSGPFQLSRVDFFRERYGGDVADLWLVSSAAFRWTGGRGHPELCWFRQGLWGAGDPPN